MNTWLRDIKYGYLDYLKASYSVREICEDGWLVLYREEDHQDWLHFAVMQFYHSDSDGSNIRLSCIFYGDGPTSLRELRHTYWGNEGDGSGYIFYPNKKIICSAFEALTEFFDMN